MKLTIQTYSGLDLVIDVPDDLEQEEVHAAARAAAAELGGLFDWHCPDGHLWPDERPAPCPPELRDAEGWATTGRILVSAQRQHVRAQAGHWQRFTVPHFASLREWATAARDEAGVAPKPPPPSSGLPPLGTYSDAADAVDLQAAHDALAGLRVTKHGRYLIGVDEAGEVQAIVAAFVSHGERWRCVYEVTP